MPADKAVYRHTCGTWCIGTRPCTTCEPYPPLPASYVGQVDTT